MKNILWLSDTHFDSLSLPEFFNFVKKLRGDALLFTGDVSTGRNLIDHLTILLSFFRNPVYLVLGNHDLWRKYRRKIRKSLDHLTEQFPHFHYLTHQDPISLNGSAALIGDDSWYDPGKSHPWVPLVYYWDWYHILDFRALFSVGERYALMRKWADQAAERIQNKLEQAYATYDLVYLALHVPPWPEKIVDLPGLFWKKYNSSAVIATALENTMAKFANKHLVVLAGHTHHSRREKITSNIELRVAAATCGYPEIEEEIWV